jgi:hypothetical protein
MSCQADASTDASIGGGVESRQSGLNPAGFRAEPEPNPGWIPALACWLAAVL